MKAAIMLSVGLIFLLAVFVVFIRIFTPKKDTRDTLSVFEMRRSRYKECFDDIEKGISWHRDTPFEIWETTSFDKKVLSARFYKKENARGAALLFHGYMSSAERDFPVSAKWYFDNGFSVLCVDERAHGKSKGKFVTLGAKERKDVHAWVKEASRRLGIGTPIILCGVSMGSTSVLCASLDTFPQNIRVIVADCGFESPMRALRDQAAHRKIRGASLLLKICDIYARLFAGFSLNECSTLAAMEKNTVPVFFMHGTGDTVVPCKSSEDAAKVCKAEHEIYLVNGAHHTDAFTVGGEKLHEELLAFINRHI